MSKPNDHAGIAKTPDEMAAKVRELQQLDMSGHMPKRKVTEGGLGNEANLPPKYTGPDGGPVYFGIGRDRP